MVGSLPDLLRRSAARDPDVEAIRMRGETLTYGALDRRVDAVASALAGIGVGRGDRVAIFAPKSLQVVTAMYATMRAGAAYVPLDPLQPALRAASVVRDAEPVVLIATSELADALLAALGEQGGPPPPSLLLLDAGPGPAGVDALRLADALEVGSSGGLPAVGRDDLAYVLYTSGSTGTPKGVALTHGNALAFVEWAAETILPGSGDRFSSHAPFHFDLSVFDLYVAATGGSAVVLVPEEDAYLGDTLARLIQRERITVWYSVPTALSAIARHLPEQAVLPLRAVLFAGEVFPTPRLRELRTRLPSVRLWNLYGPTETNVVTAYEVVELPEDERPIPIGTACSGADVFVVGEDGRVVGPGGTGELYVSGPTVMQGYWNRPEQTAEVLVSDPRPGERGLAYRTGDLVRVGDRGLLEFVGRRDHQVKSRGYRIELGEVEAALHADPRVADAVAVAVPHPEWGTEIVAYVVPSEGVELRQIEVRRETARRLPRYMVPSTVHVVPELPRTSTGKLDRRALMSGSGAAARRTR
jgi:amino acid adenylation domain-containing protein